MKHVTLVLVLSLITILSCKKDPKEKKPKSSMTVILEDKSYELELKSESFTIGDTAKLRLFAAAPNLEVGVQAASTQHNKGVGEYYLSCCNNDFWEIFTFRNGYEGVRHFADGNRQSGNVSIKRRDDTGYEGSFISYGRNSDSVTKRVEGSFKIYY